MWIGSADAEQAFEDIRSAKAAADRVAIADHLEHVGYAGDLGRSGVVDPHCELALDRTNHVDLSNAVDAEIEQQVHCGVDQMLGSFGLLGENSLHASECGVVCGPISGTTLEW